MPSTNHCRACGCAVQDRDIRSGQAKRDGHDLYCVECSLLIAEPEEQSPLSVAAAPADSGRQPAGSGLRAGSRPSARSSASSARRGSARPSRRVEPEARVRPSSHRMSAAAGRAPRSGRNPAAAPAGRPSSAQHVAPASPLSSSSSRRAATADARQLSSRRAAAAPANEPQAQSVDFGSGSSCTRSARISRRDEGDGRRGRFSSRGNAQKGKQGNATVIAMIAGGLVVIGLVALVASSFGSGNPTTRQRANEELSPQEYVRMADEQMRMGNKMKAHEYLLKASEGWERMGQEEEARQCNMRAYSIGKNTTINDYRR